jgi:hypothetical protein
VSCAPAAHGRTGSAGPKPRGVGIQSGAIKFFKRLSCVALLLLLGSAAGSAQQRPESAQEVNARLARQGAGLFAGIWDGGYQWLRFGSAMGGLETYRGVRATAGLTYRFRY